MAPATRQDVQNIMNVATNRIVERTITRQDLSMVMDMLRQLAALHQQSQQMLKASEYQRLQQTRRSAAVEARLGTMENEVRTLTATMNRMMSQKAQPLIMPVPTSQVNQNEPGLARQYGYEPTR